jgi:hypothetical protein
MMPSLKVFVFFYVNATLSSNIKSRLYNYSAFVSKDLTIFAGKSKNEDGDSLLSALTAGIPALARAGGIFPGAFSHQHKKISVSHRQIWHMNCLKKNIRKYHAYHKNIFI